MNTVDGGNSNKFFQLLGNVSSNVLSFHIIIQTVVPKSGLHNALLLVAPLVLVYVEQANKKNYYHYTAIFL